MFRPTKKQLYRQTEKIADALIAEQQFNDKLLKELIALEDKNCTLEEENFKLKDRIWELEEKLSRYIDIQVEEP